MTEPTTQAGRALVEWGETVAIRGAASTREIERRTGIVQQHRNSETLRAWAVAIEREARAPLVEALETTLRQAIANVPHHEGGTVDGKLGYEAGLKFALRALLAEYDK